MTPTTVERTLELVPRLRLDVIDVCRALGERGRRLLSRYRKAVYFSHHTTAGYFEQRLCARLDHDPEAVKSLVRSFQRLFPPGADYQHDRLELRRELDECQRRQEPRNADSHLTFIGSGLLTSVTYLNQPRTPVYFVDLDGVNGGEPRSRRTTVIGFDREERVASSLLRVPVSRHAVDSVNLKDPRLGFFAQLDELVARHDLVRGRIDIALESAEQHAGLTVNEYETMLMKHDLAEVVRNPFRFMMEKSGHMLRDPRAIPTKARDYAKYDLVQLVNEFVDAFGLRDSMLERIMQKCLAVPAARFLRMKRGVSLLVSDPEDTGRGRIIQGQYQSPILVQWAQARRQCRRLRITLHRFA